MDQIHKLELINEWSSPGSYSRCDTWHYAQIQITNWLKQKKYPQHKIHQYCRSFAKKYKFKGSLTDNLILSYQNFQLFRSFVNEKVKEQTPI